MRAQMITKTELDNLQCNYGGPCPSYLYENLSTANTEEKPWGYWTSIDSFYTNQAIYMRYDAEISANLVVISGGIVSDEDKYGLRPVINLEK